MADDQVEVLISRKEYEQLRQRAERANKRSGRMSLRLPYALGRALDARHAATGLPKSRIVVDALKADLQSELGLQIAGLLD